MSTLSAIAAESARTALSATADGDSLDPASRARLRVLAEMAEDAVPPEAEEGLGDPADPRTAQARERVRGWMAEHVRARLGAGLQEGGRPGDGK